MQILKFSGELKPFLPKKIYHSVKDAGGSPKLAREAVKEVKSKYKKGFSTKDVLDILIKFLKKEPGVAEKYDLKRAIMSLGPTGFPFEKFFAKVLKFYGFKTKIGKHLKGKAITHEIDIIAEKNKKFMIECKYHNQSGTITRLHPAMYTYARFLDIKKHGFDKPWLVTNTRCSLDARKYAKSVGVKITSWKYPKDQSIQKLIERKKLYPITILKSINEEIKEKLFHHNIIILKDFEKIAPKEIMLKIKISKEKIEEILKDVYDILN